MKYTTTIERFQPATQHRVSPEARKISEILALADVTINGQEPYDVQVHDERFFQ